MRIEIISGSPRTESVTKRVALHLLKRLSKPGDLSAGLIDIQAHQWGFVQKVRQGFRTAPPQRSETVRRGFEADAFILVTRENNGSYSPALKNFLDHFPKQNEKAFGIVTASPSPRFYNYINLPGYNIIYQRVRQRFFT